MRIHLIYLDLDTGFYPGSHHGLAAIFASLSQAGHEGRLTHLCRDLAVEQFVAQVADGSDAYGFSAMTNQFRHVRRFAGALAEATGKPILAGGVHATLAPQDAAATKGVTCACQGEGEIFLPKFLDTLGRGGDWKTVPGACYVENGKPTGSFAEYAGDLDALPAPDYSPFDMKRILHDLGGRLSLVVSRGCPFVCAFCCNEALRRRFPRAGDYVRLRSPQNAVDVTARLVERHNPASLRFEDDLLLLIPDWRRRFLRLFRERIGLAFECNSRADIVDDALADELARSGCLSVDVGIETGDQRLRTEVLQKRISDDQIIRTFEALHRAGLKTYAYNIVGLPTETEQMARRTYALNRRVRPSAGNVFYFYPYPGTALKELAERKHLLREDYEAVGGYTEQPCVNETHVSYAALRRVFRKLKMYLFLQRFRTFFPLPQAIKIPLAHLAWGIFLVCPPIVALLFTESRLKRWLRRIVFKV